MTTWEDSNQSAIHFFDQQCQRMKLRCEGTTRVLDFGCGAGALVRSMRALGYDAHGCDTWGQYAVKAPDDTSLREIEMNPYRVPYEDGFFDVVVSTSVFEHAQNKEECFREIHRVLKPGGVAMHVVPGKWYLPTEPHIYVPLVSWIWPNVPRWWLGLWAWLGVRNEYQTGKPWREVLELNAAFCDRGLSYWSTSRYREVSDGIFGRHEYPMRWWIEEGGGGFNRLIQRLPRFLWGAAGVIAREFRMGVLVQHKVKP